MNSARETGDVVERCDWCSESVDRDNARYEQVYDTSSDEEIVLTACGEEHLRWLRGQYAPQ